MTLSNPFGTVPAGAQERPTPFDLYVDEDRLKKFKTLLELSPIAKGTYENLQDDGSHGRFGVSRKWMIKAKEYWQYDFDW